MRGLCSESCLRLIKLWWQTFLGVISREGGEATLGQRHFTVRLNVCMQSLIFLKPNREFRSQIAFYYLFYQNAKSYKIRGLCFSAGVVVSYNTRHSTPGAAQLMLNLLSLAQMMRPSRGGSEGNFKIHFEIHFDFKRNCHRQQTQTDRTGSKSWSLQRETHNAPE